MRHRHPDADRHAHGEARTRAALIWLSETEEAQVITYGMLHERVERAAAGARRCALQALSALRDALGSLDRVVGIAQLSVFVASAPGFTKQPAVGNGASELLVELLGDAGRHARIAVGVQELPLGAAVEVAVVAVID